MSVYLPDCDALVRGKLQGAALSVEFPIGDTLADGTTCRGDRAPRWRWIATALLRGSPRPAGRSVLRLDDVGTEAIWRWSSP
jgi:hypothetical protein